MTPSESTPIEAPAPYTDHLPSLKLAGATLLTIGVIDMGVLVYCIHNNLSYSSKFNLPAVIAGVLLLGGSLRTASVVRWISVMTLSAFAASLPFLPFFQPLDLTLVQVRLAPWEFVFAAALYGAISVLLVWLVVLLGDPTVEAARAAEGRRKRDMRIPVGLGAGMTLLTFVSLKVALNGETAEKAKNAAMERAGPEYHYTVSAIKISSQSVSAFVTVWNDKEVFQIPVSWKKQ